MKRRKLRPTVAGTLIGLCLLLGTASVVWACTAQPRIFSLGPQVGPVGLQIMLEGQAAGAPVGVAQGASGVPVEVRWNSLDGPKIGEGVTDFSGNFAVSARIPGAEPGIYFLIVKAGDAGVVRSPFEVTSESALRAPGAGGSTDPAASSADLWSAFSESGPGSEPIGAMPNAAQGPGIQALAGVTLLAAGSAALAAGLVVSRRRSRTAGRESHSS